MLTRLQYREAQNKAARFLRSCGIAVTPREEGEIEVVDHGLGYDQPFMVQILVYVNTEAYCAKELILFPEQIVPEHRHPPAGDYPGKQETFRCRFGEAHLHVPGEPSSKSKAELPDERKKYLAVWREITLRPGDQYTLAPDTLHWMHAGPDGAIVSEFSSKSIDEFDVFTDPAISRITEIK
jgi:D-lyxose ketol-isomerase